MFLNQIFCNLYIFFLGLTGIIVYRNNVLLILICIEMVLLSLNLNFILLSLYLDDIYGQIFSLLIITIAGAESALGISVLVSYYNLRGNINVFLKASLRY